MSNNTIKHTGLKARLESLPSTQAATVGDLLELTKIVNHNTYRNEAKIKHLESLLIKQKIINEGLVNNVAKLRDDVDDAYGSIDTVWKTVNVIDSDLDAAYEDINDVNDDASTLFVRASNITDKEIVVSKKRTGGCGSFMVHCQHA